MEGNCKKKATNREETLKKYFKIVSCRSTIFFTIIILPIYHLNWTQDMYDCQIFPDYEKEHQLSVFQTNNLQKN